MLATPKMYNSEHESMKENEQSPLSFGVVLKMLALKLRRGAGNQKSTHER